MPMGKLKMSPGSKKLVQNYIIPLRYLLSLADKEWKKENAERASFFASVAADYSVIYQTVCKAKRK